MLLLVNITNDNMGIVEKYYKNIEKYLKNSIM